MGFIWQYNWDPELYIYNVEASYPYIIAGVAIAATLFIGSYGIYVYIRSIKEQ